MIQKGIHKGMCMVVAMMLMLPYIGSAGEGMWLPQLLKALNEQEMQSLGMKLSAEDIYSVNKGSLKDAIAHFGGFCTSEVISDKGLLLTNHHCGYGQIQSHSSLENNMLKNGFWAKSYGEELANPDLFVTFIERIDDVSTLVLAGVRDGMSDKERQSIIDMNIATLKKKYEVSEFKDVIVRPFYNGNQYFAFQTVSYRDIRLVGTPPESIGKFGADTDNWVFPRHTGDFAFFRIYAGPNNEPANYSEDNKPFTPKHFLPISLDGVEEGDFTMVFGFPGRTKQYLPSPAVEQTVKVLNPAKIEIRDRALKIIDKYMRNDEATRIKYASKFARVANYWKKWIGESKGLKSTGALQKKYDYEKAFAEKAHKKYAGILPAFKKEYAAISPYAEAKDYYSEVALRNVELLGYMRYVRRLVSAYENNGAEAYNDFKQRLLGYSEGFYKNLDVSIDKEVFASLADYYQDNLVDDFVPVPLRALARGKKAADFASEYYDNTLFASFDGQKAVFDMEPAMAVKKIKSDPLYALGDSWNTLYTEKIASTYNKHQTVIDSLQRIYMKAQMETFKNKRFWPDANSTMRVTYGNVKGYSPRDAVRYRPKSYTRGILEKYVEGDYEFDVPEKLREIIQKKDFGEYADETGDVPVCFIGTNHTTGGNSGSPAIDAYGNLVGLNFDRVWEGTMSDLNYDASICRNIMVDARYIMFIVDKYAKAQRIIDEVKFVRPKKK